MKPHPNMYPQNGLPRAGIESGLTPAVVTELSEEDRAFIVDKLAEMLVLDYQANQAVRGSTVVVPSVYNRKAGVMARRQP